MKTRKSLVVAAALSVFLSACSAKKTAVIPMQGINTCIANLKQLDGAKESWGLENKKRTGDTPAMTDLVPNYMRTEPRCPVGSVPYNVNPLGVNPSCPNYNSSDPNLRLHMLGAPQ